MLAEDRISNRISGTVKDDGYELTAEFDYHVRILVIELLISMWVSRHGCGMVTGVHSE